MTAGETLWWANAVAAHNLPTSATLSYMTAYMAAYLTAYKTAYMTA